MRDLRCDTLNVKPESIVPEAAFKEDLGAESLDPISVIVEFEDTFGTEISDEDAEKLKTVGDAVTFIQTTSQDINIGVSHSFAFGGHNTALLLRRVG